MLISVVATRTPFGYWGFAIAREIVTAIYGKVHHVHALAIDTFREGVAARDGKPVIFTTDMLPPVVADLMLRTNSPVIFFLDDPEETIAFEVNREERDFQDSLQFATNCMSRVAEVASARNAIRFSKPDYADAAQIVERIARFLLPGINPALVACLLAVTLRNVEPGSVCSVPQQLVAHGWAEDVLPDAVLARQSRERAAIYRILGSSYRPLLSGDELDIINVPAEMIRSDGQNVSSISLLGPNRCLTWGPYIHLPRGLWLASLEIGISQNPSGDRICIDAVSLGVGRLAEATTSLPDRPGKYSCSLAFAVTTVEFPVEIRCSLLEGAIEGEVSIRLLTIKRQAPAQSAWTDEAATYAGPQYSRST